MKLPDSERQGCARLFLNFVFHKLNHKDCNISLGNPQDSMTDVAREMTDFASFKHSLFVLFHGQNQVPIPKACLQAPTSQ